MRRKKEGEEGEWQVSEGISSVYQHSAACSDRLSFALYASDLLTHHFSLYCGLEGKSEGHTHTHTTSCVCMSLCARVFILKCQFGMLMLYQPCSLGAECP